MNINKIYITGRLGADAEVIEAGSSKLVKFSLASTQSRKVNEDWIDDTTWFHCEAWKRESVAKYLVKGLHVAVEGKMKCDEYQDKDGNNRKAWKVVVHQIDFISQMIDNKSSGGSDLPF